MKTGQSAAGVQATRIAEVSRPQFAATQNVQDTARAS